jgi:hypothetical protein
MANNVKFKALPTPAKAMPAPTAKVKAIPASGGAAAKNAALPMDDDFDF